MGRPHGQRDADRLALGRDAVLTVQRAAELLGALGGTDAQRVQWLRAQPGLVRNVKGPAGNREVVVYGDALDLIRNGAALVDETPRPTKPAATLPRPYRL